MALSTQIMTDESARRLRWSTSASPRPGRSGAEPERPVRAALGIDHQV
jgi:hypothetical protein